MTPTELPPTLTQFTVDDSCGCWVWTGHISSNGYGKAMGGKYAHRLIFEALNSPIPAGLDLDHLCRNRSCVNPSHLEPVTRSVNLRRSPIIGGKAQTHCVHGHLYDEANTYRRRDNNRRDCRTCMALRSQRRRELRFTMTTTTSTQRVLRVPKPKENE